MWPATRSSSARCCAKRVESAPAGRSWMRAPKRSSSKTLPFRSYSSPPARYHPGEDKFAPQPQLGGRGRRQASEVRLPAARRDDRARTWRGGIAEHELKLPQLAATATERHDIIALGVDSDAIRRRTHGILDAVKTPDR